MEPSPPLSYYDEVAPWYRKTNGMFCIDRDDLNTQDAGIRFKSYELLQEVCWGDTKLKAFEPKPDDLE